MVSLSLSLSLEICEYVSASTRTQHLGSILNTHRFKSLSPPSFDTSYRRGERRESVHLFSPQYELDKEEEDPRWW